MIETYLLSISLTSCNELFVTPCLCVLPVVEVCVREKATDAGSSYNLLITISLTRLCCCLLFYYYGYQLWLEAAAASLCLHQRSGDTQRLAHLRCSGASTASN
mgnify:CR=1 FL=1